MPKQHQAGEGYIDLYTQFQKDSWRIVTDIHIAKARLILNAAAKITLRLNKIMCNEIINAILIYLLFLLGSDKELKSQRGEK